MPTIDTDLRLTYYNSGFGAGLFEKHCIAKLKERKFSSMDVSKAVDEINQQLAKFPKGTMFNDGDFAYLDCLWYSFTEAVAREECVDPVQSAKELIKIDDSHINRVSGD